MVQAHPTDARPMLVIPRLVIDHLTTDHHARKDHPVDVVAAEVEAAASIALDQALNERERVQHHHVREVRLVHKTVEQEVVGHIMPRGEARLRDGVVDRGEDVLDARGGARRGGMLEQPARCRNSWRLRDRSRLPDGLEDGAGRRQLFGGMPRLLALAVALDGRVAAAAHGLRRYVAQRPPLRARRLGAVAVAVRPRLGQRLEGGAAGAAADEVALRVDGRGRHGGGGARDEGRYRPRRDGAREHSAEGTCSCWRQRHGG